MTIPGNGVARVLIPAVAVSDVKEGGKPAGRRQGAGQRHRDNQRGAVCCTCRGLRNIPIFVLVGSSDEELIARSYLYRISEYNECKKKSFP